MACVSLKNLIMMTHQTERRPRHAAYKRQHKYEFELEDERGWSGQHGQHPTTEEEVNYRPSKTSSMKDERPDRNDD